MGWTYLGILLLVSALLCAVGFYRYVYFISIGYGAAVAGLGAAMLFFAAGMEGQVSLWIFIICLLLMAYGIRLFSFLIIRERKNDSYKKTLKQAEGGRQRLSLPISLGIWIGVSILYVAQVSPVFFRLYNGRQESGFLYAGAIICLAGIIIESAADFQKGVQKKARPDMVAMAGLYRIVRCPNYLGEILFWTGVIVSGLDALRGPGQWGVSLAGYACIVAIMFNGASRLERRQMKRYGGNKEYICYAEHTPILLPILPLYHLNRRQ